MQAKEETMGSRKVQKNIRGGTKSGQNSGGRGRRNHSGKVRGGHPLKQQHKVKKYPEIYNGDSERRGEKGEVLRHWIKKGWGTERFTRHGASTGGGAQMLLHGNGTKGQVCNCWRDSRQLNSFKKDQPLTAAFSAKKVRGN